MCKNKTSEKTATTGVSPLMLWAVLILWVCLGSPVLGQHYAYIPNMGIPGDPNNDDLSILDLSTNTVVATVPVGDYPQAVAINPAGTAAYVANTGDNSFTVIDIPSYNATTIAGPGAFGASGVAMHPNGTRIYVTNPEWGAGGEGSTVWVIDRATHTIIDEIPCGRGSCGIAVHPDGKTVYVGNAFDGTLAVFDTVTHAVLDTIALETVDANEASFPVPLVIHPEGTYVYAANRSGPTFWAVNTATHEVLALPFGHTHVCMGIHPDGTAVYLPDFDDADKDLLPQGTTVDVIDTETLELVTTIEGMVAPLGVSVHPDRTRLYVVNPGTHSVSVLDARTYAHITDIPVGTLPEACGHFIGPGVPRPLKTDAVARLEAVKATIEGGADGVVSPLLAIEHLVSALDAGNFGLRENLWSGSDAENLDPRRLDVSLGNVVFETGQAMVEDTLESIRRGWIINAELRSELLAIVDQAVRADRVLAAVAIDDAIVGAKPTETIELAQALLENGNALVKEAKVWDQMNKKAMLLTQAIIEYQHAWQAALD